MKSEVLAPAEPLGRGEEADEILPVRQERPPRRAGGGLGAVELPVAGGHCVELGGGFAVPASWLPLGLLPGR